MKAFWSPCLQRANSVIVQFNLLVKMSPFLSFLSPTLLSFFAVGPQLRKKKKKLLKFVSSKKCLRPFDFQIIS